MSAPEPDKKRRLPLLPKTEVAAPEDEERPPWHWSAIGAVGVFVLWLPLAFVINGALAGRQPGALMMVLNAAAFAIACAASGYVVGRFGGLAGAREAMIGGAAAGVLACAIAAVQDVHGSVAWIVTWLLLVAVIGALGGGAARAGGALGVAARKR